MKKSLACLALASLLNQSHAGTMEDFDDAHYPTVWTKLITVSAGPAWGKPGESRTVSADGQTWNDHNTSSWTTLGTGEIFFAVQREAFTGADGQIGIAIAGTTSADVNGRLSVTETAQIADYHYKVNTGRITVKGKLIGQGPALVLPYISGSAGISWNHSYGYRQEMLTPTTPILPFFATNTANGFAFTLGAGLQRNINRHWQFGVGYEFAGWGKSRLANAATVSENVAPRMENMYTHELQFSLTYVI